MNLFTKQKNTHRYRKQTYGYQRGNWGRDKLGVWDKHPYIAMYKINNKHLLYSTGNYIQYLVITSNGGEGNVNPLQYSCLENFRDSRAWQAKVYGVTKSQTRLSDSHSLTTYDGKGSEKEYIYIYIYKIYIYLSLCESLCCSPETNITL